MDALTSETQNRKRIKEVESAFSPSGVQLSIPDRVLVGEGTLMKQGRKKWEQKAFFLFSDILVYGSILMNNRWYKKQKVILLQDIKLEDMEDGEDSKHQWLICTPCKSFFVCAPSYEEKKAWIAHIEACQQALLQEQVLQPNLTLAKTWIPNHATQKCMRCFATFTSTNRRHHCRKCGFVVCNGCSKGRAIIEHINPNKPVRICKNCSKTCKADENFCNRGNSFWDDAEERSSGDE